MCWPVCGGPPLTEKQYVSRSTVRQSARSTLNDASTSQFLTSFSIRSGSEPAVWFDFLPVGFFSLFFFHQLLVSRVFL